MRILFFDMSVKLFGGAQRSTLEFLHRIATEHQVVFADGYDTCPSYHAQAGAYGFAPHVLYRGSRFAAIGGGGSLVRRSLRMVGAVPALLTIRARLARLLRRYQPDVVLLVSPKAVEILASLPESRRTTVVYWCRGWQIPDRVRRALRRHRRTRYLCLGEATKVRSVAAGTPAGHIDVVPNAVDLDRLTAQAAQPLGGPLPEATGAFRLLVAGALLPGKGQACAIRALARLRGLGRTGALYLAGETGAGAEAYAGELKDLAERLGVADHVHFLGWRLDVPQMMIRSTAAALPSHTEGMPRTVMEAMALRVPVIATPVGNVPEMLNGGRAGWIVPVEDDAALAEALIEIMDLPERRAARTEAAYAMLRERYTPAAQVRRFQDALASIGNVSAGDP